MGMNSGLKTGLTRTTLILALPGVLYAGGETEAQVRERMKKVPSATVSVTAEASAVEVAKTPHPVTVIPVETIQRQGARDLGELLTAMMPGQMISYGLPGMTSALYLGGAKASHSVVMIDGIRFKDSSGLGTDFSAFGTAGVDHVEVLQGASSTLYGSDAHGGVVSMLSAPVDREGFQHSGSLRGGNQGQGRVAFKGAYGWKGGWATGSMDGAKEQPPVPMDKNYRKASGHLGAGLYVGDDGLFQMNFRKSYQGAPLPYSWGPGNVRILNTTSDAASRIEMFQAGYRHALSSSLLLNFNTGQAECRRAYTSYKTSYVGRSRQALTSLTYLPTDQWSWTFLGDAQQEDAWKEGERFKNIARHLALAVEGAWEPTAKLRLVGSARQQWDRVGKTVAGALIQEAKTEALVWKLGVNILLESGFRAYASTGNAYNTPSLANQAHNASMGVPELKNEESHTHTLGASWQGKARFVKLEAYRSTYTNLVAHLGASPIGPYVNLNRARIQGTELSGGHRETRWSVDAFARIQECRDLSLPKAKQLSASGLHARPFATFGLRAHRAWGDWRLNANAWHIGHRYNTSSDQGGVVLANKTHFTESALALNWRATAHLDVTLRAEHLLQDPISRQAWLDGADRGRDNVSVFPGYPAQTRTFSLEARWRY